VWTRGSRQARRKLVVEFACAAAAADVGGDAVVVDDVVVDDEQHDDDGLAQCKAAPPGSEELAAPGRGSPHCSLRPDSCPPACRQHIGPARANRSGRPPDSGEK
jgi:hypothetical protein